MNKKFMARVRRSVETWRGLRTSGAKGRRLGLRRFVLAALVVGFAASMTPATASPIEKNVDRPGGNYKTIDLKQAKPKLCKRRCDKDGKCKAWTYAPPRVKGGAARCMLKNSVPAKKASKGKASGVKKASQKKASGAKKVRKSLTAKEWRALEREAQRQANKLRRSRPRANGSNDLASPGVEDDGLKAVTHWCCRYVNGKGQCGQVATGSKCAGNSFKVECKNLGPGLPDCKKVKND